MSVDEAMKLVTELRARVDSGLSHSDKREIAGLYKEVLGKELRKTSCRDCYRDACIEIYLYLKKNGAMKEKSVYTLLNGFIIQEFGTGRVWSNANLTDEAAERYLRQFPGQIRMFAAYPEDWRVRCGIEVVKRTKKRRADEYQDGEEAR